jgi:hypothetical protein
MVAGDIDHLVAEGGNQVVHIGMAVDKVQGHPGRIGVEAHEQRGAGAGNGMLKFVGKVQWIGIGCGRG